MKKGTKQSAPSQATTYFTGRRATTINAAGVSLIGQSYGNHATEWRRAERLLSHGPKSRAK
jgi:hypothetical protein